MFKEFKEFALKGNLIDISVAFVMGAAFTKLSTSFIEDLIMPFIGKITGGVSFTDKFIPLFSNYATEAKDAGGNAIMASANTLTTLAEAKKMGPVFAWGNFVTIGINFMIVAFVMFLVVKTINKMKKAEAAAPAPGPSTQEVLLMEIRDLLKK